MSPHEGPLFTPIDIGKVRVRNRFVRSATHEWMCEEDGTPKPELGDLLEALAKGGVGLIVTGYSYVNIKGKSIAGQNAMHEDRLIPLHKSMVDRVHSHGARIFMQLVHGGRQALVGKELTGEVIAPSAVPDLKNDVHPREMTEEEILGTIDDFVASTRRAKEAGFDGVQLHVAHGFLLSSFISPHTNRRTDRWGGPLENRARIMVEILRRVREELGPDYPVTAKINGTDGFLEEGKGLQVEDSVDIAKILAAEGLKAIEVSGGIMEAEITASQKHIRDESLEAYFLDHAQRFKAELDIPVMSVGGMRSLSVMEAAVSSGRCDMVSLCRPLIREPALVDQFRTGRTTRSECLSCNLCFDDTGVKCIIDKIPPSKDGLPDRK
jgi:2,4-dienoyl-CoA reductase-like NADH-dependent reductase (Old Yellow Enzyme family)